MTSYEQGFLTKLAEMGVSPYHAGVLMKLAARDDWAVTSRGIDAQNKARVDANKAWRKNWTASNVQSGGWTGQATPQQQSLAALRSGGTYTPPSAQPVAPPSPQPTVQTQPTPPPQPVSPSPQPPSVARQTPAPRPAQPTPVQESAPKNVFTPQKGSFDYDAHMKNWRATQPRAMQNWEAPIRDPEEYARQAGELASAAGVPFSRERTIQRAQMQNRKSQYEHMMGQINQDPALRAQYDQNLAAYDEDTGRGGIGAWANRHIFDRKGYRDRRDEMKYRIGRDLLAQKEQDDDIARMREEFKNRTGQFAPAKTTPMPAQYKGPAPEPSTPKPITPATPSKPTPQPQAVQQPHTNIDSMRSYARSQEGQDWLKNHWAQVNASKANGVQQPTSVYDKNNNAPISAGYRGPINRNPPPPKLPARRMV